MWRKLRAEEKEYLLDFYKSNRNLIRIFFGVWLAFGIVFEIGCLAGISTYIKDGDLFGVFTVLLGAVLLSGIFIFLPIACMKNIATKEIKAINNDEVLITEARYIRSFVRKDSDMIIAVISDGYNEQTIESRFIGKSFRVCKDGDIIYVYMLNPKEPTDLMAFKKDV